MPDSPTWLEQLEVSAQRNPANRLTCKDPECCDCTYGSRHENVPPVAPSVRGVVRAALSVLSQLKGGGH